MNRKDTLKVKAGNIFIGGSEDLIIQSMTSYKTSDIENIINEINYLESLGCQLIRVSVLDMQDALAIKEIKKHINIPLVADIHFDSSLAIQSIESGADKIRINPGNFPLIDLEKVIEKAKKYQICIRIGVNYGSIDKKYSSLEPSKAMFESIKEYVKLFESYDFNNLILSVKSSNIIDCIEANRLISKQFKYPIHIGLTEAGDTMSSVVSSTIALGKLIEEGIGNTIRVSINGNREDEIYCAKEILKNYNIRTNIPTLIACPTCGRCKIDTKSIVKEIKPYLYSFNSNIKVAVMGCVVNGIGESSNADLGIAGGDNCAMLFKKGQIISKVPYKDIVKVLKEEIKKIA